MTSADIPTVFIVDDDGPMRAAMQRLLKTVGLHSESFANAAGFPASQVFRWPKLPCTGYTTSRNDRTGGPAEIK
jgi:hypothetical protein